MQPSPRLVVVDDELSLARAGAEIVAQAVDHDPEAAVLAATGNSPMGLYAELARRRADGLDTTRLRVVQLDEYVGMGPGDGRSLGAWLRRSFVGPLGIPQERVIGFDALAADREGECLRFEREVAAGGGIDLAILGLGPNGHLGFNEPPSRSDSPTRVVELAPESIASNARYWDGDVATPTMALTVGMATLLAARRIVLVVAGAHKREILALTLEGPVTEALPASYLQEHPACVVLADSAAAGR